MAGTFFKTRPSTEGRGQRPPGRTGKAKPEGRMERYSFTIRNLTIGGGAPVTVQTMWKKPLSPDTGHIGSILKEIHRLASYGCDLIRFSSPTIEDARTIASLAKQSPIPVVADIHFDHKIALEAIRLGVDKVRINPGNIGSREKAEDVLKAARDHGVVIRIGINGGSLPSHLRNWENPSEAMIRAAEEEMELTEKISYKNLVFSLKSSDIDTCVNVNRLFHQRYPYPLHLGLTEAGPLIPGTVKSTLMLSTLLKEGIGETIRISLSDQPEREILAAVELLKALGLRKGGVRITSCPRCGRSTFDTHAFLGRMEETLAKSKADISVAIMGCVVNGPEEARHADLGITGSGNQVLLFQHGSVVYKGPMEKAEGAFLEILRQLEDKL